MIGAALIAVMLTVTAGVGALGAAIVARHRAQSGADLAALAGAAAVPAGAVPACVRADGVVRAMHAVPADCRVIDLDLVVIVEVAVLLGRWPIGTARAAARAGPAGSR